MPIKSFENFKAFIVGAPMYSQFGYNKDGKYSLLVLINTRTGEEYKIDLSKITKEIWEQIKEDD